MNKKSITEETIAKKDTLKNDIKNINLEVFSRTLKK